MEHYTRDIAHKMFITYSNIPKISNPLGFRAIEIVESKFTSRTTV